MENNGVFKEYYERLKKEGIIKAVLCGITTGAIAMFVSSLFIWFFLGKYFWLAFIIWVVVGVATTPLFYQKKFRPTTRAMAARVDALGLEERVITMTQLRNDESYIAMRQREDAIASVKTVKAEDVRFVIPTALIVAVSVVTAVGLAMTTVSGLATFNVIAKGEDYLKDPVAVYTVMYEVDGEGTIEDGEQFQRVEEGKNAEGVLAVADTGWMFLSWSDGVTDPYREDTNITDDKTVIALFAEIDPSDDGQDGEPGEPGDGEGEGEGEGDGEGDLDKPSDSTSESDGNGSSDLPSPGGGSGGDNSKKNNQVIDGKTYYGDEYSSNRNNGIDKTTGNGEISSKDKQGISDYYNGIGTTDGSGSGGN